MHMVWILSTEESKGQVDEQDVTYEGYILGGMSCMGYVSPKRVMGERRIPETALPYYSFLFSKVPRQVSDSNNILFSKLIQH